MKRAFFLWGVVMRFWVLLFVALGPALGFGQEPLIVEATQQRDTPFKIEHAEGAKVKAIFASVNAAGGIEWAYLPDAHFIREAAVTYMAAPPGEYLITAGGTQIIKVIEEGKPNPNPQPPPPNPGPKPDPNPGPDPAPDPDPPNPDKIKVDWAVWVEESSERFQHEAESQTMYAPELWQYLSGRDIKRFVYDDDHDGAKAWVDVAGDKLPALILYQVEPQKMLTFPAPRTVADAKTLIEEHAK